MKNKPCCHINDIVPFLKTVSDVNRLQILCFLRSGEKCVCEIVDFLQLPQNLISHHLKKLREEGILLSRKEGLNVRYSINTEQVSTSIKYFISLF